MDVSEFSYPKLEPETDEDGNEKKLPVFPNLFDSETDKKHFTALGIAKLREKFNVDEQSLHTFVVDADKLKQVYVDAMIQPDLLVIRFSDVLNPSDMTWKQLLYDLALEWTASTGFDMLLNFPGEGVYVIAAVIVDSYHEDAKSIAEKQVRKTTDNMMTYPSPVEEPEANDLQCGQTLSRDDPNSPLASKTIDNPNSQVPVNTKSVVYYRGFITKLNPGKDINSAKYEVFLYDKGFHMELTLEQIIPLSHEFRYYMPSQYQLLKFPGLKPLKIIQRCIELYTRKKANIHVLSADWPIATLNLVTELLATKTFKLELLAVHGLYMFANLIFKNVVDDEEIQLDYVRFLESKGLAEQQASYFDELLKDAEDEGLVDWILRARTCS